MIVPVTANVLRAAVAVPTHDILHYNTADVTNSFG